eukprot:TRINITY_DN6299_c0_g1_i1.p1 TRINITY_DN6299_c0_g1~~TRINITY_DN6299_c0_g1_i1.p1  ORF type:complete len:422 (+),score=70.94 TRINITY_DN6299_c0_g1_i1:71-1336(+)
MHHHRHSPYPMVPYQNAIETVLQHSLQLDPISLSINDALGYILSQDVIAPEHLPPFPASVKDGYAVVASDGAGAYPVLGIVTAGHEDQVVVQAGTIAQITTGASMPVGSDAVVMVEDTEVVERNEDGTEKVVSVLVSVEVGQDVRPIGVDIRKDMVLLEAGLKLGPAEIGLLATVGIEFVHVYRKPVVSILSTGDELVEYSEELQRGKIRDSNRPMLKAYLSELGIPYNDLGISEDTQDSLKSQIFDGIAESDVLITSGGVSMGELDLLKPILEENGTVHFGRVMMMPGKPMTFATLTYQNSQKLIFALPGNPVSSLVTFQLFAVPSLKKMMGYQSPNWTVIKTKLAHNFKMNKERPQFHRGISTWNNEENIFLSRSTGKQASSFLLSMVKSNVLLHIPQGEGQLPEGTLIDTIITGTLHN